MKKIALTSFVALFVAAPAFAESFPSNEYMLENKTYDNAATYDNMGIYEGSVNADAEYTDCAAGKYCDTTGTHDCPSGYPNSAMGSSESTQCYTACTVANANIAHATAVSGNDYNGGTDTCSATACEDGYHVDGASSSIDLNATIGTVAADAYGFKSITGTGDNYNETAYGITENGTFAVDYGSKGIIRGHAKCSSRSVTASWYNNNDTFDDDHFATTLPDSSGRYCYCQLDSYTPVGGVGQSLSGPWVFNNDFDGDGDPADAPRWCEDSSCVGMCAYYLQSDDAYNLPYRIAIFGVSTPALATCEANEITINWSNVDSATAGQRNESTATYGGDINTPFKAEVIPGKTFVGWKFVKPECVTNQDCQNSGMGGICMNGVCGNPS